METTVLKLLDGPEIDLIASKLEIDRGEFVLNVVSSAAEKPLFIGYSATRPGEDHLAGRVLAAAELATGIFVELEVTHPWAEELIDESLRELAPALMVNYRDRALGLDFPVYVTEVALVPERVVGDVNFQKADQPA